MDSLREEQSHNLELWGNQLALNINDTEGRLTQEIKEVKQDVKKLIIEMQDLRGEMHNLGDRIMNRIDAASEVKEKFEDHEERIAVLEEAR